MRPADEEQHEISAAAGGALTVERLMALLAEVEDKQLPVQVEGCDCSGWASGIAVNPEYQFKEVTYPAFVEISRGEPA